MNFTVIRESSNFVGKNEFTNWTNCILALFLSSQSFGKQMSGHKKDGGVRGMG